MSVEAAQLHDLISFPSRLIFFPFFQPCSVFLFIIATKPVQEKGGHAINLLVRRFRSLRRRRVASYKICLPEKRGRRKDEVRKEKKLKLFLAGCLKFYFSAFPFALIDSIVCKFR